MYLLKGPDNAIAARTVVQDLPCSDTDRNPHVSYDLVSGLQILEQIQIDEHVLRFSPVPVLPEEVPTSHEDD